MADTAERKEEVWALESHLTELRWRLFACLLGFLLSLLISIYLVPFLLLRLQALAPTGSTFFQIKPGELFFVYFKLAVFISILLSGPFCIYQLAAFVWPGLKLHEKRIASVFFVGGPCLFVAGVLFAYFVAIKPMLAFLLGFGVNLKLVEPHYSLDFYVSLVTTALLISGLAFQLPVLLFVAACLGLLTSAQLVRFWKEAIFAAFVLAAIITPTPDPINMSILGLALAALYGGSLFAIKLIGR